MRKILLLISASILTFFSLQAQIIITQADMPAVNDTLRVSFTNDSLDPAQTGANFTWNYSYLTPTAQWVRKFDSPTTFTFPFNVLFNPINTSYGEEQYTPDSIVGIKPDNAYFFYKNSSSSFKQVGQGLTINSIPIPIYDSIPDRLFKFPEAFGNLDSSDAQFHFNVPGMGYFGEYIHRVNEADGWGTLTTPFGTFQALRVKSAVTRRDTFADTTGNGYSFTRPVTYEFKWMKQGGKVPYLQVNANMVGGNYVPTNIQYRDSMRAGVIGIGVNDLFLNNFKMFVYPNPATDIIVVSYSLLQNEIVKMELFDATGRKISDLVNSKEISGEHMDAINLKEKNIQRGIYFLKVSVANYESYSKIILQ